MSLKSLLRKIWWTPDPRWSVKPDEYLREAQIQGNVYRAWVFRRSKYKFEVAIIAPDGKSYVKSYEDNWKDAVRTAESLLASWDAVEAKARERREKDRLIAELEEEMNRRNA